jgi:hypothetical protein
MFEVTRNLQVGQMVRLGEQDAGFTVTVLPPGEAGQVIAQVESDYIIVEDAGAGVRTRIPGYLITALRPTVEAAQPAA